MLMFGKMSVGVRSITRGLITRISSARTTNVYGRLRAIWTIHTLRGLLRYLLILKVFPLEVDSSSGPAEQRIPTRSSPRARQSSVSLLRLVTGVLVVSALSADSQLDLLLRKVETRYNSAKTLQRSEE